MKPIKALLLALIIAVSSAPPISQGPLDHRDSLPKLADPMFGEHQLMLMLHDRPDMKRFVRQNDKLWVWASLQFAGSAKGSRVYWSNQPCALDVAYHLSGSAGDPTYLTVPPKYPWGADGNTMWAEAVYEFMNMRNDSDFEHADDDAARGEISESAYILRILHLEYDAAKKTKLFEQTQWLSQMRALGLDYHWRRCLEQDFDSFISNRWSELKSLRRAYAEQYQAKRRLALASTRLGISWQKLDRAFRISKNAKKLVTGSEQPRTKYSDLAKMYRLTLQDYGNLESNFPCAGSTKVGFVRFRECEEQFYARLANFDKTEKSMMSASSLPGLHLSHGTMTPTF